MEGKSTPEWIEIKEAKTLPQKEGMYWVIDKYMETNPILCFYSEKSTTMSDWLNRFTHYTKLIKPELPNK